MLAILISLLLPSTALAAMDLRSWRTQTFCGDFLRAQKINPGAIRGIEEAWPSFSFRVLQREVNEMPQTIVLAGEPRTRTQRTREDGRNLLASFNRFALEGVENISHLAHHAMTLKPKSHQLVFRSPPRPPGSTVAEACELVALDMAKWDYAEDFVIRAKKKFGPDPRIWTALAWAWLDQRCANMKITGPTRRIESGDTKIAAVSLVDPDVSPPERLSAIALAEGHRPHPSAKITKYGLPLTLAGTLILAKLGDWGNSHAMTVTLEAAAALYLLGPIALTPVVGSQTWYRRAFPLAMGRFVATSDTMTSNLLKIEDWSSPYLVLVGREYVPELFKRLEAQGFIEIATTD